MLASGQPPAAEFGATPGAGLRAVEIVGLDVGDVHLARLSPLHGATGNHRCQHS